MTQPLETIVFHNPAPLSGLTGVVNYENATIHGVSLITGAMTAEGHDLYVDATTLSQLHALGSKMKQIPVTLDHGGGISSINGYVDNVRLDGNKWRGDWHLLRSHKETETMLERADRQPGTFGMSVAFKGPPKGVLHMGKQCARAERLLSVDCVTRAAANPDGMFSVKDPEVVDIEKKDMSKAGAPQNEEPTLADVMKAIGELSSRVEQGDLERQQIIEHLNQSAQGPDGEGELDTRATLEQLYNSSDEELASLGLSRQEVDAAVAEFNASLDAGAAEGGEGEGQGQGEGGEGYAAGGEGQGEMAGAGAGAGGVSASTPATFAAIQREVVSLRNKIQATELRAANEAEEIQMSEIQGKITVLAEQRDQAIQLAEKLVVENEALQLCVRTGTRPVRPGVDNGVRLFSANGNGELHEFQQRVKETVTTQKISEAQAIQFCVKEFPALHSDWLQSQEHGSIRS